MACDHTLSLLAAEMAEVDQHGGIVVTFTCTGCLARITKAFHARMPEPSAAFAVSEMPLLQGPQAY